MSKLKTLACALAASATMSPSPAGGTPTDQLPPPAVGCWSEGCLFDAPEGVVHDGFRFQASSAPGAVGSVGWWEHVSLQPAGTYFVAAICNGSAPFGDGECGPWSAVHQVPAPPAPRWSVDWDAIAMCESGGDWHINTGNGYYGGLQFSLPTWRAVGGSGYPHQHSADEQKRRAEALIRRAPGHTQWPSCWRHG
jgi:hypothetical protein